VQSPLVTIDSLTKIFSPAFPPALQEISAAIPRGKIVGLIGPDGAGKTTLIRLMAALLIPTQGKITVEGKETISQAGDIHEMIGYMPQKFGLYEDLTVMQNLNLYADLQGLTKESRASTIEKLLQFTTLTPFKGRLARALSGGMKQKLGLACALMKKPTLLLLDEPSVGVDPISRRELWKMVHALVDEGISVIWSTAYLDEAEKCDIALLLNKGTLLFYGNPQDLTKTMQQHTFLIRNGGRNRRNFLKDLLTHEGVMDGVIQGKEIRIVMKEVSANMNWLQDQGIEVREVAPRFEDAFINILGGGPKMASLLADRWAPMHETSEKVIESKELTKKFGTFTAADHINLTVQKGEVFGLLGPNGAGKSTTFKMLCGLLQPTSGRALINGVPLQEAPSKARSQIGYMAQKFSLYSNLTVLQNLEFFAGIYNLEGQKQKQAIDSMIEIFDLKEYINTAPDLLPLGFKQRLSLACATMHSPPILFLDEPTSGVDPIIRREFWNHINALVEKGVTVMVTTHFMDEAEYCDRIALIYQGKVINMDRPDILKEKCKTAENPDPTLEEAFIKLIEDYDG
jgi:ABC-2 type transport system ATP-binding protein